MLIHGKTSLPVQCGTCEDVPWCSEAPAGVDPPLHTRHEAAGSTQAPVCPQQSPLLRPGFQSEQHGTLDSYVMSPSLLRYRKFELNGPTGNDVKFLLLFWIKP